MATAQCVNARALVNQAGSSLLHHVQLGKNSWAAVKRAVNRAAFGNLQEPLALHCVERTGDCDVAPDEVDPGPALLLALRAVAGVHALVTEFHLDRLEIPLFPVGIQPQRHGRSGTQRGQ